MYLPFVQLPLEPQVEWTRNYQELFRGPEKVSGGITLEFSNHLQVQILHK
jgi:hypothetical protein